MSTSMADSALGLASLAVLVLVLVLASLAVLVLLLALTAPSLVGDICVTDYKSLQGPLRLNGFPCKRPKNVAVNDNFFNGLAMASTTRSAAGSSVVVEVDVDKLPGLNTLGVSMVRIDYEPRGLNPSHTHPRATEIVFVLEGSLDVGFVTMANRLFTHTVHKGEVFVFPRGLLHFQKNSCANSAVVAIC